MDEILLEWNISSPYLYFPYKGVYREAQHLQFKRNNFLWQDKDNFASYCFKNEEFINLKA